MRNKHAAALCAVFVWGCAEEEKEQPGPTGGTVKIVSELPLTGPGADFGGSLVNAVKQALDEAGGKACGGLWTIQHEAKDHAGGHFWDGDKAAANAAATVADPAAVAVIGTLNSGAATRVIPVLNPAGLLMISPANTYPALTQPGIGEPDEPAKYYPGGPRNYCRVVPADNIQGVVAAKWAKALGATSVYVTDMPGGYPGFIADLFVATAPASGLTIAGRLTLDENTDRFVGEAATIRAAAPSMVFVSGFGEPPGRLVRDLRGAGYTGMIMGPDGIQDQLFSTKPGPTRRRASTRRSARSRSMR